MNRILYIGKYYPLFSYESKQTEIIVNDLNKKGNNVILLSKSWCDVNESNFVGDVKTLTNDKLFYKRFYIDPLQVRESNQNIVSAYFGLACKIIEYEKINKIIFADDIEYSLIIELLHYRYHIPCCLFLFTISSARKILDNYIIPYIRKNLLIFDKIYTFSVSAEFLKQDLQIDKEKVIEAVPFKEINIKENEIKKDNIYLLCREKCDEKKKEFLKDIIRMTGKKKENVFFIIQVKDIKKESNEVYIKDLPKCSLIISEEENKKIKPIEYSYILTVLASGNIPVISEKNFRQIEALDKEYFKIGGLYAVTNLKMPGQPIDKVFK